MDETIFIKTDDGIKELVKTPYAAEVDLQKALAQYPEVLAGPSTLESASGPLLLLGREVPIPDADSGSSFRIDHLFVTADAVPVLVETKQKKNPDMKRKVIGQMLEYAAHAMKYWDEDRFHKLLAAQADDTRKTIQALVGEVSDQPVDKFVAQATANLKAGRLRLIFVSDEIPARLARVIEFLNEQMDADVLGVALPQFTNDEHTAYLPRVVGKTAGAVTRKAGSPYWSRDTFLELADSRASDADVALIKQLLGHSQYYGGQLSWGKGQTAGVSGRYSVAGTETRIWEVNLRTESSQPILQLFFSVPHDASPATTESAAAVLAKIPALTQSIQEAPDKPKPWHIRPIINLSDVSESPTHIKTLFKGLNQLTGNTPDESAFMGEE